MSMPEDGLESTKRETATATPPPERYEEIVTQLNQLVERLESGGLSLEDAIAAFERGIQLARAGAAKLDEAERRVEVLLEGNRTEPLAANRPETPPGARPAGGSGRNKRISGEEDLPF